MPPDEKRPAPTRKLPPSNGHAGPHLLTEKAYRSAANDEYIAEMARYWEDSPGALAAKLQTFPKYVSREDLTKFLARNEIFLKQREVHGAILDLGVFRGCSLLTWYHLSCIYEPVNYTREIIGFDTFQGIPVLSPVDTCSDSVSASVKERGFAPEPGMLENIARAVRIHDQTRFLSHIPKVRLIEGDIAETLPRFVAENPHLIVSLLHIDVDVYNPTQTALKLVLPLMPKGAVILFDEIGNRLFPGETKALADTTGISALRIQRLPFAPAVSYAVIE